MRLLVSKFPQAPRSSGSSFRVPPFPASRCSGDKRRQQIASGLGRTKSAQRLLHSNLVFQHEAAPFGRRAERIEHGLASEHPVHAVGCVVEDPAVDPRRQIAPAA